MKVTKVNHKNTEKPILAVDCFVDGGYLQSPGGALP